MPLCALRLAGAAALALWLPAGAPAAPLQPGAELPALQISDQHQRPLKLDASTRLLIFAADMAGSDLVKGVLQGQAAGLLERLQAVYLVDLSAMPGLITQMVALPRLRELPYAVGVVRDAERTADLPRLAGQATVLLLDAGRVTQVRHVGEPAQLRQLLGIGSP
jgi:hypothetical protein